jgi:lysophospholipase L1-like esterase
MNYIKVVLKIFLGFVFISFFSELRAQEIPFWRDIQAFKKQDSLNAPIQNAILFIGSSSFTNWTNIQADFPEHQIVNRAFGGSTLKNIIYYYNDIVTPYHPRQVIIYCGENDFAESDTVSSETVFLRFKQFYKMLRNDLGDINIAYVSIKPSPSRQHLLPKMIEANRQIKNFIKEENNIEFIDVFHEMIDKDGNPKKDIFVEDQLHMNEKGYSAWIKVIKPFLKSWN